MWHPVYAAYSSDSISEKCFYEENEPYAILSKYRTIPQLGVAFGNYYHMDFHSDQSDYEKALLLFSMAFPANLGYLTYDEPIKANPRVSYDNDKETNVRIYKKEILYARL